MEAEKPTPLAVLGKYATHAAWVFSLLGAVFGTHQYEVANRGEPGFYEKEAYVGVISRLDNHDKKFETINDKLDTILERLPPQNALKILKDAALNHLGPAIKSGS